ncbi:MAG: DUF6605 domain-containing protein [Caldilineaceae bacterium]
MPVDFNTLSLAVEGYPDRLSYLPGETVAFHCSTRVTSFTVEIARIGAERDVVWRSGQLTGTQQSTPNHAYAKGCGWPVTFTLPIPAAWRSGFYEVTFHSSETSGPAATSHAGFVVRASQPPTANGILLVLATNTYNAYNKWGGHCLYTGATQVSFQRPWERGFITRPVTRYDGRVAAIAPEGDPEHQQLVRYLEAGRYPLWCASGGWHNWERRFVRWAESNGFQLDYAINSDLEFHPEVLDGYRLLLSVGHDEYWSWAMRDRVDSFVESGGNHAIFSGNTSFWQVRYADDGQTMVCYKGEARAADPVMATDQQERLTTFWSHPLIGRPENLTTGLSFTRGGYVRVGGGVPRSSGAYTVYRPDHWAFAGTGLHYGDLLGLGSYIVGYETDGCALTMQQGLPVPTHEDGTPDDFTILATSPARLLSQTVDYSEIPKAIWADPDGPGDLEGIATDLFGDASPEHVARIAHGNAVMGSFTRGKGSIFNSGTTDWSYGLDSDKLVQRVTANVLQRLSSLSV